MTKDQEKAIKRALRHVHDALTKGMQGLVDSGVSPNNIQFQQVKNDLYKAKELLAWTLGEHIPPEEVFKLLAIK